MRISAEVECAESNYAPQEKTNAIKWTGQFSVTAFKRTGLRVYVLNEMKQSRDCPEKK